MKDTHNIITSYGKHTTRHIPVRPPCVGQVRILKLQNII
jgi:hypothetical protein